MMVVKKNLELGIFTLLGESVAAALSRNIEEDLALDLIHNQPILAALLVDALTREKFDRAMHRAMRYGKQCREFVFDAGAAPYIPQDMVLVDDDAGQVAERKVRLEKRSDGHLYANGKKVERFRPPQETDGKTISGFRLWKEMRENDEPVLNACFLDVLTSHQGLIPEDWKTGYTYFFGTRFRDVIQHRHYVGCLFWLNGKWHWAYEYLGHFAAERHFIARIALAA